MTLITIAIPVLSACLSYNIVGQYYINRRLSRLENSNLVAPGLHSSSVICERLEETIRKMPTTEKRSQPPLQFKEETGVFTQYELKDGQWTAVQER